MVILDTDHLTLFFAGGEAGERLRSRLESVPADGAAAAIVSYEEQTRGWLAMISKARTLRETIDAYRHLNNHLRTFIRMPLIDFTELAAVEFQRLRKLGVRIGTMDLRIAAIALSLDATVLTRNTKDFGLIPDLKIEDWTKPSGRRGNS